MAAGLVPAPDEVQRLADDLSVLAEQNRVRLLMELRSGPRAAGDLAAATGMAPSLASHHLAVLLRAGFVDRSRSGSHVFYVQRSARVVEVVDAVAGLRAGDGDAAGRSPA